MTPCAKFGLTVSQEGGTMSALVLGDDLIKHRRCTAEYTYALQDWFAWVEMHAWTRINAYYESERPKEIFLVVGQHLCPAYAIAHKKYGSFECEVILEASAEFPNVVEPSTVANINITKAHATAGFENVVSKSPANGTTEYTFILHTYNPKSGPLQRFKKRSLRTRIEEQYQYASIH